MRRLLVPLCVSVVALLASAAVIPIAPASAASSSTPIVVGGEGSLAENPDISAGFNAGLYRFNQAGGLDGRKIQYTGFLDDGFSPATSLTNVQQLVDNKHVMAVVPLLSSVATSATGAFLATNKTPFVGWSINAAFETQPKWGFGINGNQGNPQVQGLSGMLQLLQATGNAKTPHKLKLALIAENIPGGIISNASLAGVATVAGIDVVYQKAPVPISGVTTYAPYAQALVSSGANAIYQVLDAPDSVGLAAALKSDNFKGPVVNGVTYFPGQLASQPNEAAALNGVYIENEFPANENNTAATKQESKDLVSTGQPGNLTSGVSVGYWSAIVFEQMLKATLQKVGGNPSKVTGATLQKTVTGGWTYKDPIAGGIGTETFPAAETIPTGCGTLIKTVGTKYQQTTPYQCLGAVNIKTKQVLSQTTGKPTGVYKPPT